MCDDIQATHSIHSTHRSEALPLQPETAGSTASEGTRTLRRALEFIDANLGERFSLEVLAKHACVSRFHFARQFRQATGYSPMEYLARRRIERGKRILARGEVSICDVAASLGFCDQSHFTRTFRRMTGQSPREYVRWQANDSVANKR